jgi:dodecin
VYGLSKIVGTSTQGVDEAIRVAVQRASRTLRGLDWFEVTNTRGHLADGEIEHFQVTLKIGSGWRIRSRPGPRKPGTSLHLCAQTTPISATEWVFSTLVRENDPGPTTRRPARLAQAPPLQAQA